MTYRQLSQDNNDMAKVAISKQLLTQLLIQGHIHGEQCLCLNRTAKNTMWQALLSSIEQNG